MEQHIEIEEIQESIAKMRGQVAERTEQARAFLDELNRRTVAMVRQHPATAVAGAAFLGYMLGRFLSRWR